VRQEYWLITPKAGPGFHLGALREFGPADAGIYRHDHRLADYMGSCVDGVRWRIGICSEPASARNQQNEAGRRSSSWYLGERSACISALIRIVSGHRSGKICENTRHSIRPATDATLTMTVQVLSVSFSVKPLSLPTTQKPLSFIHDRNMAPKPMAMNM
jgi:hypothetical protein